MSSRKIFEDNLEIERVVNGLIAPGLPFQYRRIQRQLVADHDTRFRSTPSILSDIRAAATYKGGGGVGDNPGGGMHALEIHQVFPSSKMYTICGGIILCTVPGEQCHYHPQ